MALDSPVISDQDSLIEQAPMQTGDQISRGSTNYSTFTRKRPVNLPNSLPRKKRQSLMSPQSIPTLDSDDLLTPDFAMTQSMYEPLEKRKQQAKLEANSKLLNLLASEKISQAAKERKRKEIKLKAMEQKKKNEEKQKQAEERRLRMLADHEAKKKRIIEKINLPSPMTASCINTMNRSVLKQRASMGSGFIEKRPISSTGKVFGFGSSATRDVCEGYTLKKSRDKDTFYVDHKKHEQNVSRMCTSQIISHYNENKMYKSSKLPKENSVKPISVSTYNISNFNKSLIKSKKVSSGNRKDNESGSRINLFIPAIHEVKPKQIHTNINGISKNASIPNQIKSDPKQKSRGRSADIEKSNSNIPVHKTPRSRTTERTKPPPKHVTLQTNSAIPNQKPIQKFESVKIIQSHHKSASSLKHAQNENEIKTKMSDNSNLLQPEVTRRPEVRFEEKENIKDSDCNLLSDSSISVDRRRISNNNLTEEEYKQRISHQRKLAKEKRRKEQEEKDQRLLKEQNEMQTLQQIQKSEIVSCDIKDKTELQISTENNISIDESESTQSSKRETEEDSLPKIITNEINKTEVEPLDIHTVSTVDTIPIINIPVEIPSPSIEMTTSTEMLDRIERKKRLDSIMSRIKKPIGGSTENVSLHMSSTTLQDMLNKGHLSGMSKTAAILMRTTHASQDLSASSVELHTSEESKILNPSCDDNLGPADTPILKSEPEIEISQESRGSCDGQEDEISPSRFEENLTTKSNLMENLVSNSNKPYFSSWQEKYSDSCSLDADDDNT